MYKVRGGDRFWGDVDGMDEKEIDFDTFSCTETTTRHGTASCIAHLKGYSLEIIAMLTRLIH